MRAITSKPRPCRPYHHAYGVLISIQWIAHSTSTVWLSSPYSLGQVVAVYSCSWICANGHVQCIVGNVQGESKKSRSLYVCVYQSVFQSNLPSVSPKFSSLPSNPSFLSLQKKFWSLPGKAGDHLQESFNPDQSYWFKTTPSNLFAYFMAAPLYAPKILQKILTIFFYQFVRPY